MVQSYEQGWEAAMEHVRGILHDHYHRLYGSEVGSYDAGWHACCQTLAARLALSLAPSGQAQGRGDVAQQEAARDVLHHMMSRISEERWCAGWLTEIEYLLWREVLDYQCTARVHSMAYQDDARDLAFLAAVSGGWWRFSPEAKDEVFVDLAQWRVLYRAWEEKRATHAQE